MKTKAGVRILSLLLCVAMITTLFSGCGDKQKDEVVEGTATEVAFNAEGKYTTTLTAENAKFSEDLSAADIKVKYGYMDNEAYDKAVEESGKTFPELNPEDYEDDESYQKAQEEATEKFYKETGLDPNNYMNWYTPAIDTVTRKDDKTLEVSFTDADAAANVTDGYIIEIPAGKAGGKMVSGYAQTAFPNHTPVPEVSAISAFDNDIKVTLVLPEGSFAEGVSADQIKLGNSFADMKIESLSCTGKNLTVQLTGSLKQSESSWAYLPGEIEIDKSALVDGYQNVRALIDIETQSFGFDFTNISVADGKVTAPFEMKGYKLAEGAKAADFTIDGAKVSGFERKSESAGVLTITVAGAADKNSAAKLLDGKEMVIAKSALTNAPDPDNTSVIADFAAADFYPVFDYAEEKDGKYTITAILYANSGTFTENLEAGAVSFADDFAGAAVTSIKKDTDTTATLIFTVDSKGVSVEDMELNGTIVLAAGTLKNRWGDNTSEASSYTREYQNESMGKFPISGYDALSSNDLENIQSIVGGFGNTTIGTITASASGIASAAGAVTTLLELTGVIESEKVKLDKIYDAVKVLQNQVEEINSKLREKERDEHAKAAYKFYTEHLASLSQLCRRASGHMEVARTNILGTHKETIKDTNGNDIEVDVANEPVNDAQYRAVLKEFARISIPIGTLAKLADEFDLMYNYLTISGVDMRNPLTNYDAYMADIYNFDTQACHDRETFGALYALSMTQAAGYLTQYYRYGSASIDKTNADDISDRLKDLTYGMPESGELKDIKDDKSNGILTKYLYSTKPRTDGYVYSYVRDQTFHQQMAWAQNSRWGIATEQNDAGGCQDWNDDEIKEFFNRMVNRGVDDVMKEYKSAGLKVGTTKLGSWTAYHCWRDHTISGYRYYGHTIGFGNSIYELKIIWSKSQSPNWPVSRWWKA